MRAYLAGQGVDLSGEQETKTRKALAYFAKDIRTRRVTPSLRSCRAGSGGRSAIGFGEADGQLAAIAPERVQESDEIYLLSLDSDASVKVRDGLMDVKRLERVNDDGLEQWQPVLKAAVPALGADVAAVLRGARRRRPALARGRVHARRARRRR